MMKTAFKLSIACALCSAMGMNAQSLSAQSFEALDALSDTATDEKAGLQLAKEQANRGEYLEALATLERVLVSHPKSHEARLIHAIYLCRVDDPRGGMVELEQLKEKHYGKKLLNDAKRMCETGEAK